MAHIQESHRVQKIDKAIRINDYLVGIFVSLPSKKSIKKALKKGRIRVDGKSVSSALWVKATMNIELLEDLETDSKVFDLEVEVVFEDDYLAILNKPAGLVSSGNQFRTLQNTLTKNLTPSSNKDAIQPKLIHRLDSATSGLIIAAKTATSLMQLGEMLANKGISKTYTAFVIGLVEAAGSIEANIDGKEAKTIYSPIESIPSINFGTLSAVELTPVTGRTHQLRIHMKENGTPILGDRLYGDEELNLKGKGLFLCANKVAFVHPITKETLEIEIPLAKKFDKYWVGVKKRNTSSN
jgi:RluA family pseudouridine synthase